MTIIIMCHRAGTFAVLKPANNGNFLVQFAVLLLTTPAKTKTKKYSHCHIITSSL